MSVPLWDRADRPLHASALVAGVALALALGIPAAARGEPSPPRQLAAPAPVPSAPVVTVDADGRVTVDARDAELADVLTQLAAAADFELTTSGQLGRVTAAFSGVPIEQALRRLAQDHEMMLVYSPPAERGTGPTLVQVDVFAQSQTAVAGRTPRDVVANPVAGGDEIGVLARIPNDPRNMARLAELARSSSDPGVRARAVSVLSRVGAPATAVLIGALGDEAPEVRVQAVHGLRNIDRRQTIPALGRVLANDPDVAVRRAAARMLRALNDPEATSMLSAGAGDSDFVVRREVTRGLERPGPPPVQ